MFEISLVDGKLEVKVEIGPNVGIGVSRRSLNTWKWEKVWKEGEEGTSQDCGG